MCSCFTWIVFLDFVYTNTSKVLKKISNVKYLIIYSIITKIASKYMILIFLHNLKHFGIILPDGAVPGGRAAAEGFVTQWCSVSPKVKCDPSSSEELQPHLQARLGVHHEIL